MSNEAITGKDIEWLFNKQKFLARPFRGMNPQIVKRLRTCHFCGVRLKKGEEYYQLGGGGAGASYLNFCIRCAQLDCAQAERLAGEERRSRAIVCNLTCSAAIFSLHEDGSEKFNCGYKNARRAKGHVKRVLTKDVGDVVAYLITNLNGQVIEEVTL